MGFKKIRYNTGESLVKIKIEDDTGAKMETWTIMLSDLGKWADTMRKKYGLEDKKDRDLDWIR